MKAMTATLVRHLNEQGYNFSIITTGLSSHVCCPLGEKSVRLLSLSFLSSEDLYSNMRWCGSFYLISIKRNRNPDYKHLV